MDSMYVYNAVPLTTTTLPAARVTNGKSMLLQCGTYGFTFASAMPLYVWGDYNATNSSGSSLSQNSVLHTEPAALMGDSVTILSDGWLDANSKSGHSNSSGRPRTPHKLRLTQRVLKALSNRPHDSASDAEGYSGGVENFLRLLENWGGVNLWYNGSIIVMFPSEYATNCWQQTGGYYSAASRQWAFDTNYLIWSGQPPLTPSASGVIRGTWSVK